MAKRNTWQTRFGFYLVAIGSALGLGNLWRFPYVVGENGGGAFVLLYVLLILIVGAPLLISELMLGKLTGQSVLMATKAVGKKAHRSFAWFGRFSVLLSLVVLTYYSVISGWVLHFLTQFLFHVFSSPGSFAGPSMELLQSNGWLQLALTSVHILFALVLVLKGFQEGVERYISWVTPVFAVLVSVLLWKSFSLPTFSESVRFLFYPDFSKLSLSSLNHAVGHVFFTLSVGFGTMVTFGSYMRSNDHVPTAGFRVSIVDTLVSLIGVVLVFPVAFQASNVPMTDPTLMFDVIPRFLLDLPGGNWFGMMFFLCLYLAALNASLGLLETVVSNLDDRNQKLDRTTAAWIVAGVCLALSAFPALSSTYLRNVHIKEKGFIEIMDSFLINWLLPLAALGLSLSFWKGTAEDDKFREFSGTEHVVSQVMYSHWKFAVRFLVPVIILVGLALQIFDLFKN